MGIGKPLHSYIKQKFKIYVNQLLKVNLNIPKAVDLRYLVAAAPAVAAVPSV